MIVGPLFLAVIVMVGFLIAFAVSNLLKLATFGVALLIVFFFIACFLYLLLAVGNSKVNHLFHDEENKEDKN